MALHELISMWERVLGTPPTKEQFELWAVLHSLETIKHGIVKTAIKNQNSGGQMSRDHKERFASKVMNSSTEQKQAGQRSQPNSPLHAETGSDVR